MTRGRSFTQPCPPGGKGRPLKPVDLGVAPLYTWSLGDFPVGEGALSPSGVSVWKEEIPWGGLGTGVDSTLRTDFRACTWGWADSELRLPSRWRVLRRCRWRQHSSRAVSRWAEHRVATPRECHGPHPQAGHSQEVAGCWAIGATSWSGTGLQRAPPTALSTFVATSGLRAPPCIRRSLCIGASTPAPPHTEPRFCISCWQPGDPGVSWGTPSPTPPLPGHRGGLQNRTHLPQGRLW